VSMEDEVSKEEKARVADCASASLFSALVEAAGTDPPPTQMEHDLRKLATVWEAVDFEVEEHEPTGVSFIRLRDEVILLLFL
jgi:hypothetical protein